MVETAILDRLSDFIAKIANETNNYYVMICGDLNSRTGTGEDYVIYDSNANTHVLPDDYGTDEGLKRFSQDKLLNQNGRGVGRKTLRN